MIARRNQHADVESEATVVADNAGAGLALGDKQVVDEIVRALRVRPNIDMACVYNKDGRRRGLRRSPSEAVQLSRPAPRRITDGVAVDGTLGAKNVRDGMGCGDAAEKD